MFHKPHAKRPMSYESKRRPVLGVMASSCLALTMRTAMTRILLPSWPRADRSSSDTTNGNAMRSGSGLRRRGLRAQPPNISAMQGPIFRESLPLSSFGFGEVAAAIGAVQKSATAGRVLRQQDMPRR
jgi:hypothetical protein